VTELTLALKEAWVVFNGRGPTWNLGDPFSAADIEPRPRASRSKLCSYNYTRLLGEEESLEGAALVASSGRAAV
jgi:hypothetical protein